MRSEASLDMNWTRPADIKAQVQSLWDRGELLASHLAGASMYPKRLAFRRPTSSELAECFDEVRIWAGGLRATPNIRLVMREFRHRVHGINAIPDEIWIDSLDACLTLIGKLNEFARFASIAEICRLREPSLLPWLSRRPLQALALSDEWDRLLDIVAWCRRHPRPNVYLREVDIPGVHTKFIDLHRGVLAELLDVALPVEAINICANGAPQFARRYGFREKPQRIRFRVLDPALAFMAGSFALDITLDADSFAALNPSVSRVFITENEINFLAFPACSGAIVIFGAGYGFEALRAASWLHRCRVCYWGDIDTHGFAILDQLRSLLPDVESFLMDRATLINFAALHGKEHKQTRRDLKRLNTVEAALYNDLRDNRLGLNLRLEQEQIGFDWVAAALAARDGSKSI